MSKKPDIEDRSDIIKLVNAFYTKVLFDPEIKDFFTSVIQMDWKKHLPIMYNFWDSTLLGSTVYTGNPMTAHINLNKKLPIEHHHFGRWLKLWEETVSELFQGTNASEAIRRAQTIASLMEHKVSESSK